MSDDAAQSTPGKNADDAFQWQLGARGRAVFILFEGSLVPVALAVGWLVDKPALATCAWDLQAAAWGATATVPLVAIAILATHWPVGPLRSLMKPTDELLVPLFSNWSLAELAMVSALAGIGEEMLFRGVAQAALSDILGTWGGLAAASVLFGLVHFLSPSYAVYTALIGAFLGLLWMVTGNLLVPAVTHGLYDGAMLVYLIRIRKSPSGPTQAAKSRPV